jgi:type II secretory ATPase GspE/PulE/Tfp pilus assembly ATPase PilB-like protein
MGVEPYLLASSVRAIIAQRLVRKICPACRRDDTSGYANELAARMTRSTDVHFRVGDGCDRCHHTGYSGRTAIFEILPVTGAVQDLILSRAPASRLRDEMATRGGLTLRERGLALAARGETSVSEVLRVTADDDGQGAVDQDLEVS